VNGGIYPIVDGCEFVDMAEAIRTGKPYQTRLDLPPGPPCDTEGSFIPMAEWQPNIRPPQAINGSTDSGG